LSVLRRIADTSAFRSFEASGPGKALLHGRAFTRWNRRRRHVAATRAAAADPARFADVRAFVLFVGHMKSGTTLAGAMLDAHPDAIVADEVDVLRHAEQGYVREELFHLLARGAEGEAAKGRVTARRLDGGYALAVPGWSQGTGERPRVIGDGRAGPTTQALADDPALLDRFRALLGPGIELRVIHAIRNPFEPIALSVLRGKRTVDEAIDRYVARCEAVERVLATLPPGDVWPLRYEDLVADPRQRIGELCAYLGLPVPEGYLDACAALVRTAPARDRDRIAWTPAQVERVRACIAAHGFLSTYEDTPAPRIQAQEVPT
jgi:hypothetical protein